MKWSPLSDDRPPSLARSPSLFHSPIKLDTRRRAGHAVEDSNYNWIGLIKRPFDDAHKSACAPVPGFEHDIPNQRSNFACAVTQWNIDYQLDRGLRELGPPMHRELSCNNRRLNSDRGNGSAAGVESESRVQHAGFLRPHEMGMHVGNNRGGDLASSAERRARIPLVSR